MRKPLSEFDENELNVLKFLNQPDYDVGGPKRRFARGKVKRDDDERPVGKMRMLPKKMRKGGSISSASKRADGCAIKGKTRGKFV